MTFPRSHSLGEDLEMNPKVLRYSTGQVARRPFEAGDREREKSAQGNREVLPGCGTLDIFSSSFVCPMSLQRMTGLEHSSRPVMLVGVSHAETLL